MTPSAGFALVADIGGTHARFALAVGERVDGESTLVVADHADPLAAIRAFLATRGDPPLTAAALAVAAPVDAGEAVLTNGRWRFARPALAAALGLPPDRVRLLNDFEALALALPALADHEVLPLGGGAAVAGAPRLALGPGTGLGAAGLVRGAGGWVAVAGEAGHVTLAAGDEREAAILAIARRRFGHVSAERLLSGSGLPLLHELAAAADGRGGVPVDTPALLAGARAGDADCARTLDLFLGWLGAVAGDLALAFGARGGVYLGGGLLPRLRDRLATSPLRTRFEAKGRFSGYLASIPLRVILTPAPALRGAAHAALQQVRGDIE